MQQESELGAEEIVDERVMIRMVKCKELTAYAKLIDDVLIKVIRCELKRKKVRWMKRMTYLYFWRVKMMR